MLFSLFYRVNREGQVNMSPQKHLVLDDDVHATLCTKKASSGLPIKEIGNSMLRPCVTDGLLTSLVGRLLVEQGHVSADEYRSLLDSAARTVRKTQLQAEALIEATAKGKFVSGSWEIATIVTADDGSFQLLECWARDAHRLPMEEHHHDADEFFVALAGRSLMTVRGTAHVLGPQSSLQVPAGCIHHAVPLDDSAHLLALLVPALPEFRV